MSKELDSKSIKVTVKIPPMCKVEMLEKGILVRANCRWIVTSTLGEVYSGEPGEHFLEVPVDDEYTIAPLA